MDEAKNYPTMIIPDGTEIAVNEQGLLSIKTPGNLVIQNSAKYSIIESSNGSVRIDPGVSVEAISVRAQDTCFVAGSLTAWRVKASKIILEKEAHANIMLQEADRLELDRAARLVGNFASEKELYLMLGRFSRQLQDLPESLQAGEVSARIGASAPGDAEREKGDVFVSPDGEEESSPEDDGDVEEILSLLRMTLEREIGREDLDAVGRQALAQLMEDIRKKDFEKLEARAGFLLSQVSSQTEDLQKAGRLLKRLKNLAGPLSS